MNISMTRRNTIIGVVVVCAVGASAWGLNGTGASKSARRSAVPTRLGPNDANAPVADVAVERTNATKQQRILTRSSRAASLSGSVTHLVAAAKHPHRQNAENDHFIGQQGGDSFTDTTAASPSATNTPVRTSPNPLISFAGLNFSQDGNGWPPDTTGDIGPNHYIQTVNTAIGIFDKTNGARLASFSYDTFFNGTGTPCDNNNGGDPTVVYDHYSSRWIIGDFAWIGATGPYYECVAVSKTADPVNGGWWQYGILVDNVNFNDYPKMAVWPSGIFITYNLFPDAGGYAGPQISALNRTDLINGNPVSIVSFRPGSQYNSMLAATARATDPPANTNEYAVTLETTSLNLWRFHVDFATPANSTLTGPQIVPVATYATRPRVATRGGETVDTLSDRLMDHLAYSNVNNTPSLWTTHTVYSAKRESLRWYQITGIDATPTLTQQSTYSAAGNRWMPSMAVDHTGDMALGYTVGGATIYPSIRYDGRLVSDATNTLAQGETTLIAGTGSQSGGFHRWGDYSSMNIDPADGCTFWYTTEYYIVKGSNWQTRIGAFKFPSCS